MCVCVGGGTVPTWRMAHNAARTAIKNEHDAFHGPMFYYCSGQKLSKSTLFYIAAFLHHRLLYK